MAQAQTRWQADPVLSRYLLYQLVQDDDGFLWAATDEGVFRYDGYRAVPLNELVQTGERLPTRACRLARGLRGELWILGSDGQLHRYSTTRQTLTRVALPALAGDYPALYLAADSAGNRLWVSQGARTVLALALGTGRPVPGSRQHLASNIIWLAAAPGGRAWVVTDDKRITCLGAGRSRHEYQAPGGRFIFPVPATAPQQFVSACAQYASGPAGRLREVRRWLPRRGGDVGERNLFSPELQPGHLQWVAGHHLVGLAQAPATGRLGACVLEAVRFDNVAGYDYPAPGQLLTDRLGTQWCFSTTNRGCYRRQRPAYLRALGTSDHTWYSTRAVCRLPDGQLLVSSYAGLLGQAAGQPSAPLRPWPVLEHGRPVYGVFNALLPLDAHRLLVAGDWVGLVDLRTRQLRRVGQSPTDSAGAGLPPPTAVLPAGGGRVWVGTRLGLYWLSAAEPWMHPSRRLPPRRWPLDIRALAADQAGGLWLAALTGLYYLNGSTGRVHCLASGRPGRAGLPSSELLSLAAAGPGRAWVGTRGQGLLLVDARRGLRRHLTTADGLPSNTVCSLLTEPAGRLWLGTYAGVARCRPGEGARFDVFTTANGLPDNECNAYSAFRDADGTLYFGGVKGLTRFWPGRLPGPSSPHRRLLVSRIAFYPGTEGDTLSRYSYPPQRAPGPITLRDYDQATLKVALTDYASPEATYYQYRLLGRPDSGWHRTVPQQTVRLLDLPPGDYVIQVRATSQAGQPASNEVRVPLRVRRTWWRARWVLPLAALLLLGGSYAYVRRSRWHHRQQQQYLRRRLAHDLHDELGSLLVRASLQVEQLRGGHAPVGPVATSALLADLRAASLAMRDIVWGLDPHYNTLGDLLDRLREFLDQCAPALGGRQLTLHAAGLPEAAPLSPLLRQHLYIVCKEAVTNSLRHAHGSTVLAISLTYAEGRLTLRVRDDGQPGPQAGRGVGRRSMQQRAQAMGGALQAGPVSVGGFEVVLTVPLRP